MQPAGALEAAERFATGQERQGGSQISFGSCVDGLKSYADTKQSVSVDVGHPDGTVGSATGLRGRPAVSHPVIGAGIEPESDGAIEFKRYFLDRSRCSSR